MKFLLSCVLCLVSNVLLAQTDSTQKQVELKDVEISTKKATRLEMTPMNVEVINSGDLVKDACCKIYVNGCRVFKTLTQIAKRH